MARTFPWDDGQEQLLGQRKIIINSFSQVPTNSPCKKYVVALRSCNYLRLANKITRWFDDTKASGKDFYYRFTGKDSRLCF